MVAWLSACRTIGLNASPCFCPCKPVCVFMTHQCHIKPSYWSRLLLQTQKCSSSAEVFHLVSQAGFSENVSLSLHTSVKTGERASDVEGRFDKLSQICLTLSLSTCSLPRDITPSLLESKSSHRCWYPVAASTLAAWELEATRRR